MIYIYICIMCFNSHSPLRSLVTGPLKVSQVGGLPCSYQLEPNVQIHSTVRIKVKPSNKQAPKIWQFKPDQSLLLSLVKSRKISDVDWYSGSIHEDEADNVWQRAEAEFSVREKKQESPAWWTQAHCGLHISHSAWEWEWESCLRHRKLSEQDQPANEPVVCPVPEPRPCMRGLQQALPETG